MILFEVKEQAKLALTGMAQWIECGPVNQGPLVRFPVRAHTWVVWPTPQVGSA